MDQAETDSRSQSEHVLAEFIRAERVRFVFVQSPIPIFFSPLAATILSWALWSVVPHGFLVGWTAGLLAIAIIRVVLIRSYPQTNSNEIHVRRWERIFVGSILVVDLWWGIGALILLPTGLAERALVFCFVMLMASGHAASYAAHPATVVAGALALTLPITVLFGVQGDKFHRVLAFAAVLYLLALFRSLKALSYFFGRTHRLAHELQAEKRRVEILARSDFLTSLNNRRAFYESGEKELRYAQRYEHRACLMMLDIDHFKSINDRFGHAAGDAVLRAVAALIRQQLRSTDVAGRLGGEEFAVLLPEVTLDLAQEIAERLRSAIEQQEVEHAPAPIRLTASLGVVEIGNGETLEQAIARADAALYAAKHAGRNRVVVTMPDRIPAAIPSA